MKIRIQDNSIRFRVTLREVERLVDGRSLSAICRVFGSCGPESCFRYGVEAPVGLAESCVVVDGPSITLRLGEADFNTLQSHEEEGAYIQREWTDSAGEVHRFMAFIEKDRPGSRCVKIESWIYDTPPGGNVETRPIPKPTPQS